MRTFLSVAAVAAAGLAIAAAAIAAGDRSVLVPPPDARVEGFLRELITRRHDRAFDYLGKSLRPSVDRQRLQRAYERDRLGGIVQVDTDVIGSDASAAEADAVLRGPGGRHVTLRFGLSWERGDWRVVRLPAGW